MAPRILIVAGEASGDLHGSALVRSLRVLAPSANIAGIGGDRMRGEGMRLVEHIRGLSFMGFAEVVRNLPAIRAVEKKLLEELEQRRPDVVVLIDYPGFNLRFARTVKRHGIPVLYYISPQIWAWNRRRVKRMARLVDRMKVIFPFEVDLYRKEGIDVEFVGHPLVEHIGVSCSRQDFFRHRGFDPGRKLLALFPGSRSQEIERILPVMIAAVRRIRTRRDLQVALGVASNLGAGSIRASLPADAGVVLVENGTYDLMAHADAAIVTSGTATLETGWFGTPMAVVYRTSPLTFFIGRMLVRVPYIGLVNIVGGKRIVPEFVQQAMTPENLATAVGRMLDDESYAQGIRNDLSVIKRALGDPGASGRVAAAILTLAEAA